MYHRLVGIHWTWMFGLGSVVRKRDSNPLNLPQVK